jgi:cytochrome c oxidase subunit II
MKRSPYARLLSTVAALFGSLILASAPALADSLEIRGAPHPWGLWTQPPASPIMERLTGLHDAVTVIIVLIALIVFALMGYIFVKFNAKANPKPSTRTHNTVLEVIWTAIPIIILVGIAVPSFGLLYAEDHAPDAKLTLKVTGHQWYWSYAFPDYGVSFDSNLKQDADLKPGEERLLTADNPLVLPVGVDIRIQVTADDVIHDFAVPAFAVKTDAVPGRLNETWTHIDQPGVYYGQCSQLCGINHGFMPIEVQAVPVADFQKWLEAHKATKQFTAQGPVEPATRTVADASIQR